MWEHVDIVPRRSGRSPAEPDGSLRALALLVLAALVAGLLPLVG